MKRLVTILTLLLGILLPGRVLADTATLHSGGNTYAMTGSSPYTVTVPSLETGFHIEITTSSGTTYIGIWDTTTSTVTVGSTYRGVVSQSSMNEMQGFILNDAPVANAVVTLSKDWLGNYTLLVTQPTYTYTCTLYANGMSYELTDAGSGMFTSPVIDSLESGFYIVKTADDGSTTTTSYCGTNGSNIAVDTDYTAVDAYAESNISACKIAFAYSPWASATLCFYPATNKVRLSGTPAQAATATYKLYGDFNGNGTPEEVELEEDGMFWSKTDLEVMGDGKTIVVRKYEDDVLVATFGPSADTTIVDEQAMSMTSATPGAFAIPEGKYDVVFNSVNETLTCKMLGLHLLSATQYPDDASAANKMLLEDGIYTLYLDEIGKNFKLYDARDKKYLQLADGVARAALAEELPVAKASGEACFDMECDAYHKVNVYVGADLSTLRMVSTLPTWTLMGEVNEEESNPAYEFQIVETTATEGVKHRLTLPELSGYFRIQKDDVYYTKVGSSIGNGDVVTLDKYPEDVVVSVPSSLTMHCGSSTTTGAQDGNTFVFEAVYMGTFYGTPVEFYFEGDGMTFGPTSATTINLSDVNAYNAIGAAGMSAGSFAENSNVWTFNGYRKLTVKVDFDTNVVTLYNPNTMAQRRREAAAVVEDGLRLSMGTLENVTLEFDSKAGTLAVVKADPAYAIVVESVENVDGSDVAQTRSYRLVKTENAGETVYTTSIETIPAGADLYVAADDGTANKFYGSLTSGATLTDCVSLSGASAVDNDHFFHVESELSNVNFTLGMGDGLVPTQLTYVATDVEYRLVGYYSGFDMEESYLFSKGAEGYQLFITELPMCGAETTGDVGFKIAVVQDGVVEYYGSSTPLDSEVEKAEGLTIALERDGANIVLADMVPDQGMASCLLTLNVSKGSASSRRAAAGVITLNVKSTILTSVEELAADCEPGDVYSLTGVCLKRNAAADGLSDLAKGVYVYKGKKLIVK